MNQPPRVAINLVVRNGERFIRDCLASVRAQSYPHLDVTIFDNDSTDATKDIARKEFPEFRIIENKKNHGFGPGQNRCLEITQGKYVLGLCVDVVLDRDFVKNAVAAMERDASIGALQAKIYVMRDGVKTDIIDSTGFAVFKSRRIINRGHGDTDIGQFSEAGEVFSYEGAVPFWRREAMEHSKVFGECHDEDFFWYADDIDLGWRMRLFGWKSWYAPDVIAYHDRSTTKRLSRGALDFIRHRKTIPWRKRMLDWQNIRFTLIKNDFLVSELKDIFSFAPRELKLFGYLAIFEPTTLLAIPRIIRLMPKILRKRAYIMRHAKITRQVMEQWFQEG